MRAELPWNVAGIAPEVREVARAAARREGQPLGEWLTRRILRSLSGIDEELASLVQDADAVDSWGLPPSSLGRQPSDPLVAMDELGTNTSTQALRRIEEQLGAIARRLESSERSSNESNRALSRAAQQMNISSREQAEAFDQLGTNVVALHDRLEKLERSSANEGIKEAVRALHLGLTRLVEQINATATNCANQVLQLTTEVAKLASQVEEVRQHARSAQLDLEERLGQSEKTLDVRLVTLERSAQSSADMLNYALEKIDGLAQEHGSDQLQYQRRAEQHEQILARLEDAIARLQLRPADQDFGQRLDSIEQSVNALTERLQHQDRSDDADADIRSFASRLAELEKNHAELVEAFKDKRPSRNDAESAEAPGLEEPFFESPPHDGVPLIDFCENPQDQALPEKLPQANDADELPSPADASDRTSEPESTSDIPAVGISESAQFSDLMDSPALKAEAFLSQGAQLAAQSCEERDEHAQEIEDLLQRVNLHHEEREKAPPRRFIVASVVVLIIALALAASFFLNEPNTSLAPNGSAPARNTKPLTGSYRKPTASPKKPALAKAQRGNAAPFSLVLQTTAAGVQNRNVALISKPLPATISPNQDPISVRKRLSALAKEGNPAALTILALDALDGTDGKAPADPAQAVTYLTEAAQKGQAMAQYRLATLFMRGEGVAHDPVQAVHWYAMAANQGNVKAMHNLAVSYASGVGTPRSLPQAAHWFAKAAELGLADSQFNLAVLYERGDGVPQSLAMAYKWYAIAAQSGDRESKARMAILGSELDDGLRTRLSQSASSFRPAPLSPNANLVPVSSELGF